MKNTRKMRGKQAVWIVALILGTAALCSGCGTRQSYQVNITDNGQRTEMLVKEGDSVASLLADAGIELKDKDKITSSVDTAIEQNTDIQIDRYAKVTFTSDEGDTTVELYGGKVKDAMEEANIELKDHDYLNVDEDEWLTDGETIVVTHRVQVTLTVDGETTEELSEAKNIKGFLKEKGITMSKLDRINYKKKKKLKEGMDIVIQRVEEKKEVETEVIKFETTTENDSSMSKGKTKVKQEGVDGEKKITYKVTYVDGVEESREVVKEKVTKEPVKEIILKGTYVAPSSSSSGGSSSGKKVVSRKKYNDCDGSGHGTLVITYSDGSTSTSRY